MVAARAIPLKPTPEYDVKFVPQLLNDLLGEADADDLILEAEETLALRFEDIPGKRIEKVEDTKEPTLYKFRPHAANDHRFIFTSEEDPRRRVVLDYWPRKNNYRKQDLKAAAQRFKAFVDSVRD